MKNLRFLALSLFFTAEAMAAETVAEAAVNKGVSAVNKGAISLDFWKDRIGNYIDTHGSALLGAVIVLAVSLYASRWIVKWLEHWLEKKPIEPPVRMLLVRLTYLLMLGFSLVIALGTAGVEVTPLVAGLGVAGVGVSLAMQGVLSNLTAGLLIIFTKPFKVGEFIEIVEVYGQVTEIELFRTTLIHADRSRVMIPNRKIVGEIVHNYGTIRQLNLEVGVAYDTNLPEAMAAIRDALKSSSRVMKELAPIVGVTTLGDSSINISVKPWVSVGDYGIVDGEIYQAIIEQFRVRKIEMPFPQREIRLLNGTPAEARIA